LGFPSGSALGASIAIVTGISFTLGYFMVPLAAFAGALVSIFTVYNIARTGNKNPRLLIFFFPGLPSALFFRHLLPY
jgi:iron complex transport system permease protein